GQLDEGPQDRALPDPLREADLPEEPLSQARADEARGVSREGHPAPDPVDARPRHLEAARAMIARLLTLALLLFPLSASAEMRLPSGFAAQVYVTGEGFDTDTSRGIRGTPGPPASAFRRSRLLYVARPGRRYVGGEICDLGPIFRFPAGGTRLTPENESRFFYGPPLPNPQVGATRRGHELFITTFDRER